MTSKPSTPFITLLQAVGLSQAETYDYLTACGMKTSIYSIRAWCRGSYNPPEEAVLHLAQLYYAITDTNGELPPEVPEGAITRRRLVEDLSNFYDLIVTVDHRLEGDFDVSSWIQSTRKS